MFNVVSFVLKVKKMLYVLINIRVYAFMLLVMCLMPGLLTIVASSALLRGNYDDPEMRILLV